MTDCNRTEWELLPIRLINKDRLRQILALNILDLHRVIGFHLMNFLYDIHSPGDLAKGGKTLTIGIALFPEVEPGVVTDTDIRRLSSSSRRRREIVVFPAPDGEDKTNIKPRL